MTNYEKDLEKQIEDLQEKLEQAQKERDTFQELLDNVIMESYKRFNKENETEVYTADNLSPIHTEAVSRKYVSEAFGIDLDKEYDRIFKERTEKESK